MPLAKKHVRYGGRVVMVGFGSIGQGTLPLILRHVDMDPKRITVITAEERGKKEAEDLGITFIINPLTRENYIPVLEPMLGPGDFLLNLSVEVSSLALIEFCHRKGVLYLDTCIEPWPGGYTDPSLTPSQRSNYALREQALELRRKTGGKGPTAILTHGANPGLVSHFVKQAVVDIAQATGLKASAPTSRAGWGALAQQLGIKVIHIAERDTQVANRPKKPGEFVNTWSVDGFYSEGSQPAELGWGSHERHFPADASRHSFGSDCAIYLNRPGASTRMRSWTPLEGPYHGFLITHGESISISDYLTVKKGDQVVYRPTVHYAYHPSDDAVLSVHELAGRNWRMQDRKRIMRDEIVKGADELGVLLAGHKKNAYWYGSQLSVQEARQLAPHNSATSLQVTVSAMAGLIWAVENPNSGVVEPDDLDYKRILEICRPYLGLVVGEYSEWHPLVDRGRLFPEDLDETDPWQFKNVRVV
jgi:homospermidine synthase